MYEYNVRVVKIVDGDTVDVDIDLGFGIWLHKERVRIMGIDTPESRTSNALEKVFGLAAKDRLKQLLGPTAKLKTQIATDGEDARGKYGRVLGDFEVYDSVADRYTTVTEILIREGHGVPYFGGSKDDTQAQHAENRRRLVAEGVVILPDKFRGLL